MRSVRQWATVTILVVVVCGCPSPASRRRAALARVDLVLATGDLDRAESELREYLRFAPRDVAARTRLAALLESRGRASEALGELESLPDSVALDLAARQLLGRLLLARGDLLRCAPVLVGLEFDLALDDELRQRLLTAAATSSCPATVARLVPANWQRQLVRRCLASDHFEQAIVCLGMLPVDDPQRPELIDEVVSTALERDELALLRQHGELLDPADSPAKLVARHRLLLVNARWAEAAAVEQLFLERYPDRPERCGILLSMARRLVRSGRSEEGLEVANEALLLNPMLVDAMSEKGRALVALGREDEAKRVYETILELRPNDPVARRILEPPENESSGSLELRLSAKGLAGGT